MEITFIEKAPALFVTKEKLLAVGDLHLGRDLALRKSGIHVPNATERLAGSLLSLCKRQKARGLVLLGDVKESIGYPAREEYENLMRFFYMLRNVKITITKGNHDARIEEIAKRLDANVEIVNELLLSKVALMHGHAMPSQDAMKKEYIVTVHSHPAININGNYEKAWVVAKVSKEAGKKYKDYNKKIRLVIMPAFNELITGSDPESISKFSPLFRNGIFDFKNVKVYESGKQQL